MNSIFETIFSEDCQQYQEIFNSYKDLRPEQFDDAYEVMKTALILADRWSEITSNAAVLAKENGVSKTDLSDWAYRKYRLMQFIHESARMIHRMGWEQAMFFERRDKDNGRQGI